MMVIMVMVVMRMVTVPLWHVTVLGGDDDGIFSFPTKT